MGRFEEEVQQTGFHDGHRTKFSPRARRCVFIGYTDGTKGYKLYDTQTKDVIVSRDVVFYEDIFPFQISEDPANIQYQLILPTEHATGVGSESIATQPVQNQPAEYEICDTSLEVSNHPSLQGLRRSNRQRNAPAYLADYDCQTNRTSPHSLSTV
nr:uncharacterized protein LOC109166016 [Ipomoea trifida]